MALIHEPKLCESCGGKFIPTRKDQRLCPDCRAGRSKYAEAKKPAEVKVTNVNKPEEDVNIPEVKVHEVEAPKAPAKFTAQTVNVGINVDTEQLEDAIEKADELGEAMARIAPALSIVRPNGCTFNINIGGKA